MNTMAFFNNKGEVGKTTLVYHLAWMFAEMNLSVVAADLDPRMNLTSMFLEDSKLEEFGQMQSHPALWLLPWRPCWREPVMWRIPM